MIEYKRIFVPRNYLGVDSPELCPEEDCLEKQGKDGWILCAVGGSDSVGTKIFYFYRSKE